jgi:hypothetical protein
MASPFGKVSWLVVAALLAVAMPTSAQSRDSLAITPAAACVETRRAPIDSVVWAMPDSTVVANAVARYSRTLRERGDARPVTMTEAVTFFRAGREWLFVSLGPHLGSPEGARAPLLTCNGWELGFEYDVAADSVTRPPQTP